MPAMPKPGSTLTIDLTDAKGQKLSKTTNVPGEIPVTNHPQAPPQKTEKPTEKPTSPPAGTEEKK